MRIPSHGETAVGRVVATEMTKRGEIAYNEVMYRLRNGEFLGVVHEKVGKKSKVEIQKRRRCGRQCRVQPVKPTRGCIWAAGGKTQRGLRGTREGRGMGIRGDGDSPGGCRGGGGGGRRGGSGGEGMSEGEDHRKKGGVDDIGN